MVLMNGLIRDLQSTKPTTDRYIRRLFRNVDALELMSRAELVNSHLSVVVVV